MIEDEHSDAAMISTSLSQNARALLGMPVEAKEEKVQGAPSKVATESPMAASQTIAAEPPVQPRSEESTPPTSFALGIIGQYASDSESESDDDTAAPKLTTTIDSHEFPPLPTTSIHPLPH